MEGTPGELAFTNPTTQNPFVHCMVRMWWKGARAARSWGVNAPFLGAAGWEEGPGWETAPPGCGRVGCRIVMCENPELMGEVGVRWEFPTATARAGRGGYRVTTALVTQATGSKDTDVSV